MSVVSVKNENIRSYAQISATTVNEYRLLTDTDINFQNFVSLTASRLRSIAFALSYAGPGEVKNVSILTKPGAPRPTRDPSPSRKDPFP
jgi:hypothetical protein